MKGIIFILSFLFVLSVIVSAHSDEIKNLDYNYYLSNLDEVKNMANENINNIPNSARKFLGSEKINIYFVTENKEEINIKIQLKNRKIDILEKGSNDKPNIEIYITEKDLNDIIKSDNPKNEAKRKLENKEIKYKTHGFLAAIKIKLLIALL